MESVSKEQAEKLQTKYKDLMKDKNQFDLSRMRLIDKVEEKKKRAKEVDAELKELGVDNKSVDSEIKALFTKIGSSLMNFSKDLTEGKEKLELITSTLKSKDEE